MKYNIKALLSSLRRKPHAPPKVDDLGWIDELPSENSLAAMKIILNKLAKLVSVDHPPEPWQLSCVYQISKQCNQHLTALEKYYASVQKLHQKIDNQIWDAVHKYYRYQIRAYQSCIDGYLANPEASKLQPHHLPILIAHTIDNLCGSARWHYMRCQTAPDGYWLQMHRLYQLAEKLNCTDQYLKFHNGIESTISARYGRALMLDNINCSGMQKSETARVDGWLTIWMQNIAISRQYDEDRHLFYCNLDEDQGARRIRHFQPTDSCRYWETDQITEGIPQFRKLLEKSGKHVTFEIIRTTEVNQCLLLLDNLYAEWSRSGYRRQRRREERNQTLKKAHVVHGIQSTYQMVKNVESLLGSLKKYAYKDDVNFEERLLRSTVVDLTPKIVIPPWFTVKQWLIKNESHLGYGAVVSEELASKLKIGKLVAVVMDENRFAVAIGVVRNIKNLSDVERHVGIEILSREAMPALLSVASTTDGKLPPEKSFVNADPLSLDEACTALILPKNSESGTATDSVILAIVNYMKGAKVSFTTLGRKNHQVRLTEPIEQKDDWIRVGFVSELAPEFRIPT